MLFSFLFSLFVAFAISFFYVVSDVPSYCGDSEAMAINSGRECVGRGTGAFETHYPSIGAIGRAIGTGDDDGKPETFLGFFSFANRIGG